MCKNEEKKQLKHCDVTSETRWENQHYSSNKKQHKMWLLTTDSFHVYQLIFEQLIQNTFSVKEKCKKIIVYVSLLLIIITIIID